MKIKVENNQTLYDVALQHYGTAEAVGELATLNPYLTNDPAALADRDIDYISDSSFYFDIPIAKGTTIEIDTTSKLCKSQITKELSNPITTYGTDN